MGALQLLYRPKNLDEIAGNVGTVNAMRSILKRDVENIPQAWLFQGPPGTGKTSLARILKTELQIPNLHYVEVDASADRSIANVRRIIQEAHKAPLGKNKRQAFLFDECFHKDTLITTKTGTTKIINIKVGDSIKTALNYGTVTRIFKNKIKLSHIVKIILSNSTKIYCSQDHLFLTNKGWIKAKHLDFTNLVCSTSQSMRDIELQKEHTDATQESTKQEQKQWQKATNTVQILQSTVFPQKKDKQILFLRMCSLRTTIAKAFNPLHTLWKSIYFQSKQCQILRNMLDCNLFKLWKNIYFKNTQPIFLFSQLFFTIFNKNSQNAKGSLFKRGWVKNFQSIKTYIKLHSKGQKITQQNKSAHENQQSHARTAAYRQNDKCQTYKWYFRWLEKQSWRQWEWANATSTIITWLIRNWMGIRNSYQNSYALNIGKTQTVLPQISLPNMLQNRHRQQKLKNRDRSRWVFSYMDKPQKTRSKKNKIINRIRVESVEIYQQGDNDASFKSIITNKEHNQNYIELYDLEIAGHPSYQANGVFVHNCHKLLSDPQNALLKVLEDTPENTWILLATTNPEKLLPAIKSRCTIMSVDRLNTRNMITFLNEILEAEEYSDFPSEITSLISKNANGACRDALKLLDTVISMEDINDMIEIVNTGYADETTMKDLWTALLSKGTPAIKWKKTAKILKEIKGEPETIRRSLLSIFSNNLLADNSQITKECVDCFRDNYYDEGKAGLISDCFEVCQLK